MAKVLLVEDDIALREIYSARFAAENFEIVTADDGEQALSVAIKEKPDIIILDIMMPKISGFDVLDILRQTPETKNTKVIIMSALSQESDIAKGKQLGADAYLVKSQSTLSDVVQKTKDVLAAPPRG
ncbi:response regulator [candidate division WS5 bacterium]|uniref:Response regulator n=1 Tax=candidate division WS5 bacterium TaxID=2093353 RepID=A0A419DA98_9BACT|nr:MAG: response regulator [candidate division WS5 bacterium]